ncbi:MAG: FixH family protein [Chloroflexi bacterium]|nr:FixH family protein [Chloroflexota bacterium]
MNLRIRKTLIITTVLALFALALAACGAPATQAAPQANVKLETNPNPARVGDVQLILTITDQNGNTITGAKVDVGAEHPSMSGMGMSGAATEQDGKYAIKANFTDSGTWKITVNVRKDGLDVKQELSLEIK